MTKLIKLTLILGLIVMGSVYHYTGFMKKHTKLFIIEVVLYMISAFIAFLFLQFIRQQMNEWKWKDAWMTVIITAIIILFVELSGLNTKFIQEEGEAAEKVASDPFRKDVIQVKKKMLSHMIISINITCLMVMFLIMWFKKSQLALFLIVLFTLIAGISYFLPQVKNIKKYLISHGWLTDKELSNTQLGLGISLTISFSVFAIVLLFSSIFHYDSLHIYSYLKDKYHLGGWKRSFMTGVLFIFESLIVAGLFAVPIIYVGYNRNHPEMGNSYKIKTHREVFIDFGLLTAKIFVFLIALQMTGFYDLHPNPTKKTLTKTCKHSAKK